MKSMNVKKLAALAVGALFAGQAYAAGLVANTLPTDKSWYTHSAIVIGAKAKPADVVWAGNIAAAIGQMAFEEKTITPKIDTKKAVVELNVPTEVAVSGTGYPDDRDVNLTANSWDFVGTYDAVKVPTLLDNKQISFKYKSSTATEYSDADAKLKEELGVKLDAVEAKVSNSDRAEIRAKTEAKGMYYELIISNLLGDELKAGNVYQFQNFYIEPLGMKYEVTKLDLNKNIMTVVSSLEEKTVPVGGEVQFEGYTIKVVDVDPDNQQAYLELYDSQGNKIADDVISVGEYTDFGGRLPDSIKLDTVFAGTQTKFAKLVLKADQMDLTKGEAKELDNYKGWYMVWNTDDQNNIILKIYYGGDENDDYLTFDTAVPVGGSFKYIGNAGYAVSFLGFKSKPTRNLVFEGSTIKFIDNEGAEHTSLLYKEVPDASITDGTDTATTTVYNFVDGQKAKILVTVDNFQDVNSGDGVVLADFHVKVDVGDDGDYEFSGDVTGVNVAGTDHVIVPVTTSDGGYTYNVYIKFSQADINDNGAADDSINDFKLLEISFASNGVTTISEDTPYKVAEEVNTTTGLPIQWTVTDVDNTTTITVPFDQKDKELDFENYQVSVSMPKEELDAKADNSYPENWWTNNGTEIKIEGSDTLYIKVPITKEQATIFVGIPGTTEEKKGIIYVTPGKSITVNGAEIKVVDVNVPSVEPITTYEPMKDWNPEIVYLDTDNDWQTYDKIIVVGGYLVNNVAKMLADEYNELYDIKEAGDWIVKKYDYQGKEYIVVFGYTADDTGKAAHEFINWLRENVQ